MFQHFSSEQWQARSTIVLGASILKIRHLCLMPNHQMKRMNCPCKKARNLKSGLALSGEKCLLCQRAQMQPWERTIWSCKSPKFTTNSWEIHEWFVCQAICRLQLMSACGNWNPNIWLIMAVQAWNGATVLWHIASVVHVKSKLYDGPLSQYTALHVRGEHNADSHAPEMERSKLLTVKQIQAITTGVRMAPAQSARSLRRNITNFIVEDRNSANCSCQNLAHAQQGILVSSYPYYATAW